MQASRQVAAVVLAVLMVAPKGAFAQGAQAPDARMLAATVQKHAAQQDANRREIRQALSRPEVRELAGRVGVDVDRAVASIDTLPPGDLARAADTARQVNQQLDRQMVGGAASVTFTTTTIIIILLLVILLIVAIK
jgi:hypothetical protein